MTRKQYIIKSQDDLFGVVDDYSIDKICVVNGIRTEIEAEWLCEEMNALNDGIEHLKKENDILKASNGEYEDALARLEEENEQLKQAYTKLKHRHSLLHDENQELECDKNEYYKDVFFLEKENRELKQLLSKTLREQYHLIKNEDKTGALVELKSIAAYLGVDFE